MKKGIDVSDHRKQIRRSGRLRTWVPITVLLATVLSACSALPEQPPSMSLYDFGVAPAGPSHDATVGGPTASTDSVTGMPPALVVESVTAHGLPTDHQALLYRYAYTDDHQLRAYQRARWSLPAEQLIAQQLNRQLQKQWTVLMPEHGRAGMNRLGDRTPALHINVERFEQVFTTPNRSSGVIQLRATLFDTAGQNLIAQRNFSQSSDASSPDAAGGARALGTATQRVVADIGQWLQSALQ